MRISLNIIAFSAVFAFTGIIAAQAQVLTSEDSLAAHLVHKNDVTHISGYGEASYSQDLVSKTGTANLDRAVLFVGHQFTNKISLFSELELENAKVEAGNEGEVAMEQAFLKFDLKSNMYIVAGLFTPRLGIINENHLPTTFNGVERPMVEQMVIPATWREIGVGLYGNFYSIPGLNYSIAIVNGLNSAGFSMESGIREGRYEGQLASARNKAITGALLYYYGPFRVQLSSYIGGSIGMSDTSAEKLGLSTGIFGTPVFLNEGDVQFRKKGLVLKLLATAVSIPDADKINKAFANNTPEMITGGYFEAGYDVLHPFGKKQQLILFGRYEHIDMNAKLPGNGIENKAYTQNHIIAGLSYMPTGNIIIKADFHYTKTGDFNQSLIINPDPSAPGWQSLKELVQLGVGYSF